MGFAEWIDLYKEHKIDLKDLLAILGSIGTLIVLYKTNAHKYVVYFWKKFMIPIYDKLSGKASTNKKLAEMSSTLSSFEGVIQSMSRIQVEFQKNVMEGFSEIKGNLGTLNKQHTKLLEEVKTNGGYSLKDASHMTNALLWTILNENDTVMILHTDAKGNVMRSNRLFRNTVGRSSSEVSGTGWLNAISPKDRDRVTKEFYNAVSAGRDYEGEYSLVDHQGNEIKVESRASRLLDPKGVVIGYQRMLKFV